MTFNQCQYYLFGILFVKMSTTLKGYTTSPATRRITIFSPPKSRFSAF